MTKRSTQFSPNIPTGPLKSNPEPEINPLTAFFRKSKLSLTLPSHGRWYPSNSLTLDELGGLAVFAMTATDDIKFRTGDATMSGKNIFEVITSCIPGIKSPEFIPNVDIDALLLAIRIASYGSDFTFNVSIPNTSLTKNIILNGHDLLKNLQSTISNNENATWDEEIQIIDETGQTLQVTVFPVTMKELFQVSKTIYMQRKALSKSIDSEDNVRDDAAFSTTMSELTKSAIDLLSSSIQTLKIINSQGEQIVSLTNTNPQDTMQIKQIINQIDIEYFNAIREHLDVQRKKYQFISPNQVSTKKEIEAGAPENWTTELTFMGSNFLPDKTNISSSII